MKPRTRRILRRTLLVALILFAAEQTWRHGYDYVLAEKFAVVDPGKVYRGAWQMTWPMKRIVRQHEIKTVVALAHPPESPWVAEERALAETMGFRFLHIPIVDDRTGDGDNEDLYDRLERAADAIADPENQPVFFHCHHGVNRASMVHMAYRMLHCGDSLDEAEAEIARQFGLKRVDKGPDYRHMRGFYESRVLPRRAAQSQASARVDLPDGGPTRQ
jgi:protein-tyrosine phosphatase